MGTYNFKDQLHQKVFFFPPKSGNLKKKRTCRKKKKKTNFVKDSKART